MTSKTNDLEKTSRSKVKVMSKIIILAVKHVFFTFLTCRSNFSTFLKNDLEKNFQGQRSNSCPKYWHLMIRMFIWVFWPIFKVFSVSTERPYCISSDYYYYSFFLPPQIPTQFATYRKDVLSIISVSKMQVGF